MRQGDKSIKRSQTKVSPLVLPHEFYGQNRKRSIEFRKDLSCQVTKSFAQRHGELPTKFRNQNCSDIKKQRKKEGLQSMSTRRQDLKLKSTKENVDCSSPDGGLSCQERKEMTQNQSTRIETSQLVDLVNEIEFILHSDTFVHQKMEEELIQKACLERKDKRWRNYYTNCVLPSIIEVGKKIIILYEQYEIIQLNRRKYLSMECFHEWRNATIRSMRKDVVEKVDEMDRGYFSSKKRNILNVLSAVSFATSSKKKILQRRKDGLTMARSSLANTLARKSQIKGIITNDMVQIELRRIFHRELFDWNCKRYLSSCFLIWKDMISSVMNSRIKAQQHFIKKLFNSWKKWKIKQLAIISGSTPGHFHFEVVTFRRKMLEVKPFKAWMAKAKVYGQAKQMQRKLISQLASNCLNEWSRISKVSRQIKINVLCQWRDFKSDIIGKPFRSWRIVTATLRHQRHKRDYLVSSYTRMKSQRQKWKLFRTWQKQAQYGRITSMYSRQELIQQLQFQSRKIDSLETKIQSCLM